MTFDLIVDQISETDAATCIHEGGPMISSPCKNCDPDKKVERQRARSKADFIRRIGIGPELAKFLAAFNEKPEILFFPVFG
jgi:hypothetical protein